jgi:hypothetical protein
MHIRYAEKVAYRKLEEDEKRTIVKHEGREKNDIR